MVGEVDDCTEKERAELTDLFDREIYPMLTPLAVGSGQPFPYISGLSLSLGVFVRDPKSGEERFARVKVPELLPRFASIGKRGLFLPLERVLRHFLPALFPKMEIVECSVFRVTRDADFEVSDEADDLLEAVELELRKRRFGHVVRVEVSSSVSSRMLERLKRGLGVTDEQIYLVSGLLDLADLDRLVDVDQPELKQEPWIPVTPCALHRAWGAQRPLRARFGARTFSCTTPITPSRRASRVSWRRWRRIPTSSPSRPPSTAPTRPRRSSRH